MAKGFTALLVHNFDALVTKDYLDVRLQELEAHIQKDMITEIASFKIEVMGEVGRTHARLARMEQIQVLILAVAAVPALQAIWVWYSQL